MLQDICFECPECTKHLCIARQGAGLYIRCTDCDHRFKVPDPAIEFTCDICDHLLCAPDTMKGKDFSCSGCGGTLQVPEQASAADEKPIKGPYKIHCPACTVKLEFDDQFHKEMSGESVSCPSCSKPVSIPPYGETAVEPVPKQTSTIPCFRCGEAIHGGAKVCSICGTNQETGERPGEYSSAPSEATPRTETLKLEPQEPHEAPEPPARRSRTAGGSSPTRLFVKTECRYCGEIILPGAKRCVHCGKGLDAS